MNRANSKRIRIPGERERSDEIEKKLWIEKIGFRSATNWQSIWSRFFLNSFSLFDVGKCNLRIFFWGYIYKGWAKLNKVLAKKQTKATCRKCYILEHLKMIQTSKRQQYFFEHFDFTLGAFFFLSHISLLSIWLASKQALRFKPLWNGFFLSTISLYRFIRTLLN